MQNGNSRLNMNIPYKNPCRILLFPSKAEQGVTECGTEGGTGRNGGFNGAERRSSSKKCLGQSNGLTEFLKSRSSYCKPGDAFHYLSSKDILSFLEIRSLLR